MSELVSVDHSAAALARLPQQYRGEAAPTNVQRVLAALAGAFQPLELALMQLLLLRRVDTAEGVHLDELGAIVGRPRAGESDDVYRRRIRAQIAANASDGRVEDLLAIANLVIDDPEARVRIRTIALAAAIVRVEGVAVTGAVAMVLIELLRRAIAAGVRLMLISSSSPPGETFGFARMAYCGDRAAGNTSITCDGIAKHAAVGFPQAGGLIEMWGVDGGNEVRDVTRYDRINRNVTPPRFEGLDPPLRHNYDAQNKPYMGGAIAVGASVRLLEPARRRCFSGGVHITADGSFVFTPEGSGPITVAIGAGYYTARQIAALIGSCADYDVRVSIVSDAPHLRFVDGAVGLTINGFSSTTFRNELGFSGQLTSAGATDATAPNPMNTTSAGGAWATDRR